MRKILKNYLKMIISCVILYLSLRKAKKSKKLTLLNIIHTKKTLPLMRGFFSGFLLFYLISICTNTPPAWIRYFYRLTQMSHSVILCFPQILPWELKLPTGCKIIVVFPS